MTCYIWTTALLGLCRECGSSSYHSLRPHPYKFAPLPPLTCRAQRLILLFVFTQSVILTPQCVALYNIKTFNKWPFLWKGFATLESIAYYLLVLFSFISSLTVSPRDIFFTHISTLENCIAHSQCRLSCMESPPRQLGSVLHILYVFYHVWRARHVT